MTRLLIICSAVSYLTCATIVSTPADRSGHKYLFESGNISTPVVEYAATFSPDGTEVYFARSDGKWGTGAMQSALYYAQQQNGEWSTPTVLPFSGEFDDSDPHITRDGNTLYFISDRPSEDAPVSPDIWMVHKDQTGNWEEPIRLKAPLNSDQREYSPHTDQRGNLYFASDRPGGYGQGDIYVAKRTAAAFDPPSNLGVTINSPTGEWNVGVNGAGDVLIFEASQREQNISSYGDLYLSFKIEDQWTVPQNIAELNTSGSDLFPFLAQQETVLYYTSSDSLKSQDTNIYYTDFTALYQHYRKQAVSMQRK